MKCNPCLGCGFYESDMGCSCPSSEMWYACPLAPEPTEKDFKEHGFELEHPFADLKEE